MNQNECFGINEKLEMFISCRQLDDLDTVSDYDPYVIIYKKNNNYWTQIGQTELIKNTMNPNFTTSILLEYYFEVQQHLKLEVHHFINSTQSKIIGIAETTVAIIVGSRDQILIGDLVTISGRRSGNFIIQANIVKQIKEELNLTLSSYGIPETRFWFWHGTSPFLRFYRLVQDDNIPVLVYETEFVKDTKEPTWKEINFKSLHLCDGDYKMQIKVELWDHRKNGKHLYLGETSFCVDELLEYNIQNKILNKEFKNKMKKQESSGILQFNRFLYNHNYTFLDYCSGGQQLKFIIAIDYTESNGKQNDPQSLHYIPKNGVPNQYLQAITSLVEILINYDNTKKISLYGFGCKPKMNLINTNQTLHLFPLNDNPDDHEVYGLDEIVQCYKKSLPYLLFDGPAQLTPNLKNAMNMAYQYKENQGNQNYLILMILTDGQVSDMQVFIDDIIASSNLPLSIIIIGIGNGNFDNMSVLNNQFNQILDSKGNLLVRDLVQFVPFNQVKNDPVLLAKQVLAKLHNQIIQYMKLQNISPKPTDRKKLLLQQQNPQSSKQQQLSQPQKSQQQQLPPQLLYPPQLIYPPQLQYPNQPSPIQQNQQNQYQQYHPQTGEINNNNQGQGLQQQGFLKELVQQTVKYSSQ
ncbi:unnamed protein product [Paramecium pentaurelia]|uniref:Uncharacterized protein n=1 Tax=Paramecium pentaurelia TaxID=43138 RepID=A0A8S1SIQ6_9CILI|nr:unnamed protein product [Paramecium pentaurelia]